MATTSHRSGSEPSEELKRELDEHVRDDETHPDERMTQLPSMRRGNLG